MKVINVSDRLPNRVEQDISHEKGKKIFTLERRYGIDYDTALALYEGLAVFVIEPTIVKFWK